MNPALSHSCSAFAGHRLLSAGSLADVALAVRSQLAQDATQSVLVFNDADGRVIDLDLRGSEQEILARLAVQVENEAARRRAMSTPPEVARGKGRPKLGVVGREVTLLPRHWEWLAEQPGGASVALRKLIDEARKSGGETGSRRTTQEAAYRFMHALAGDLPGYEEATRLLFAGDLEGFENHLQPWPADVREYAIRLAKGQ